MPLPNWTRQQFLDYAKSDPAGAQAMYNQYISERAQIQRQSILNQQEAAKGPSNSDQWTQAIGGPVALIGGLKAGQYIFGGPAAASTGATTGTTAGLSGAGGTIGGLSGSAGSGATGNIGSVGSGAAGNLGGVAPSAPVVVGEGTPGIAGSLGGALPALGVAAQAYQIGSNAVDAYKAGNQAGGAIKGAKAGVKGKGGLDMLQNLNPFVLQARLAGGILGGLSGHDKNYYAAKDRNKILSGIQKQYGPLNFKTKSGGAFALDPRSFEKDPNTYNYDQSSPTMAADIGAANPLSYLLTGEKVGSKKFTDVAGALANASKAGVSANDLYSKVGLGYRNAFDKIQADQKLSAADKAAFLNGLDQTFQQGTYTPRRKKK